MLKSTSNPEAALTQRCQSGHFYDSSMHVSCPYCGIPGLVVDVGPTVPLGGGGAPGATQPLDTGRTGRAAHKGLVRPASGSVLMTPGGASTCLSRLLRGPPGSGLLQDLEAREQ